MTDDSDDTPVTVFLDRIAYQCVGQHLDRTSSGRSVMNKAVLLGNTWIVECTATQANNLLTYTKLACPNAVSRIIEGIHAAGLTPQDD